MKRLREEKEEREKEEALHWSEEWRSSSVEEWRKHFLDDYDNINSF